MAQIKPCVEAEIQDIYVEALRALEDGNVPFALGGAFAVWYYTGHWRHTHDIDAFTDPDHVADAVKALLGAGFEDLGEQAEGDRGWIFHGVRGNIIVDIIFKFANQITAVSPEWIEDAPLGELLGEQVKFLGVEELFWSKMFTLNRHRCDWPDLMRIIRGTYRSFDWDRLLGLIGEHWLLLSGLIDVFDWQHPGDRDCIPERVRQELRTRRDSYRPKPGAGDREKLLDPWIHSRPEDQCYLEQ